MKTLTTWATAALSVFAPVHAAVISAFVLILADLITGVLAAHKRGELITSNGIKATVYKIFVYESAILMAFLAQTYLTGAMLPVCNLATAVVGLTEMKSILENLDSIAGGSFFKVLISKVDKSKSDIET